jgi:hypothetical protein
MDDPLDLSDSDFMRWAGISPQRWAVLPEEKREAWLDHLIARFTMSNDDTERNAYWRLATVISRAGAPGASA